MPQFLTIQEVADLVRLGERTVYTLARDGRIGGATKIGNQWRFDRDELFAWLKSGGAAQTSMRPPKSATSATKRRSKTGRRS